MADNKEGDVQFTFDAEGFDKAMKQITSSLTKLEKGSDKFTKNVSKGVASGMMKFQLLFEGLKKGFGMVVNAVNKQIPEIGQAFHLAGDIISRNLLWPLRKEILPMLQGMLNWVTKNRKMFAEWGSVLVTLFRGLQGIFKSIMQLLEPVGRMLKDFLNKVVGKGSLTDQLNLFIFKITVSTMAFMHMIKPLTDQIFSLVKAVGDLAIAMMKLVSQEGLSDFWRDLARFTGQVVANIKVIVDLITGLLTMNFDNLVADFGKNGAWTNAFSYTAEKDKAAKSKAQGEAVLKADLTPEQKAGFAKGMEKLMGGGTSLVPNINDGIVTKDGKVIKTDPQDNIIATKGGVGGRVSMNFGNFYFNVTEGNAKAAGENFIGGLESQIRKILMNNLVNVGGQ